MQSYRRSRNRCVLSLFDCSYSSVINLYCTYRGFILTLLSWTVRSNDSLAVAERVTVFFTMTVALVHGDQCLINDHIAVEITNGIT